MKNLVTGGAGFLGSHLIDNLIKKNEKVICLDNYYTGTSKNIEKWLNHPNFKLIEHDITDPIQIETDKIWHLACPASPLHYQLDPIKTARTSFLGTYNMLELATKVHAKILFASSSEIYGSTTEHPQNENSLIDVKTNSLRSCYSEGKRMAETLCFNYKDLYGVDVRIARIFNTYGPRLSFDDGRVISNFINNALKGLPLKIYGDGKQTRSFSYVDDIVEGLLLLMNSEYNKPINLGSVDEISINDLANLISHLIEINVSCNFEHNPFDDVYHRRPDINDAIRNLKWHPKIKLIDGLKKTISFFRENFI